MTASVGDGGRFCLIDFSKAFSTVIAFLWLAGKVWTEWVDCTVGEKKAGPPGLKESGQWFNIYLTGGQLRVTFLRADSETNSV